LHLDILSFPTRRSSDLTLIVLSLMPVMLIATYFFKRAMRSSFQDVRTWVSRLNTFLQEHISGISVIQYFAREKQEYNKFIGINADRKSTRLNSSHVKIS